MAYYPVVLDTKYGLHMFCDGNGMGKIGLCYTELIKMRWNFGFRAIKL